MTNTVPDTPILHHYDISPFCEKIRLIFGLKGLAWRSVEIPMVLPKPDYVALTGGYRRTPAMQIGAEIFCDTLLIADEIERRWPEPTIYPDGHAGQHKALAFWAETNLFWPAARAAVGANVAHLPAEFHADRAAMFGRPPPDPARIAAAGERARDRLRPHLDRVERLLDGHNGFLAGPAPGLADVTLYHGLWFLDSLPNKLLAELTDAADVHHWMARVAALGHGTRSEMTADAALAEAAGADALPPDGPIEDRTLVAGQTVAVEPLDGTTAAVTGGLALLTQSQVAVRRHDPRAGEVLVHFPRLGYRVSAA